MVSLPTVPNLSGITKPSGNVLTIPNAQGIAGASGTLGGVSQLTGNTLGAANGALGGTSQIANGALGIASQTANQIANGALGTAGSVLGVGSTTAPKLGYIVSGGKRKPHLFHTFQVALPSMQLG